MLEASNEAVVEAGDKPKHLFTKSRNSETGCNGVADLQRNGNLKSLLNALLLDYALIFHLYLFPKKCLEVATEEIRSMTHCPYR